MTDTLDRTRSDELNNLSRRGFGALSVAAGVAAAGVAEAAVEVVEEEVNVKTPDGVADAVIHYPKGKKSPAVLVWTDIFGLRPVFRDMGRRLAASGYTVLTPNPFYRIGDAVRRLHVDVLFDHFDGGLGPADHGDAGGDGQGAEAPPRQAVQIITAVPVDGVGHRTLPCSLTAQRCYRPRSGRRHLLPEPRV